MDTWIALLRGVNVGGKNVLPMAALSQALETIGLFDIRTYIQSGNLVFLSPDAEAEGLAERICAVIHQKFGFLVPVVVMRAEDLSAMASANPFSEAATESDGKSIHCFFSAKTPNGIDRARLDAVRRPSERWEQKGRVLYLHAPEGFGRSKLATQVEMALGVPATARNWQTVRRLLELAKS